jgi:NAD(P)-dependent dehydrogenase (short-subunit alcohol dehydrogenase family)
MGKLTGKVAIITGATSGIGKATAVLFADEGADLVITGRRKELGKAVEAEIRRKGVRCVFVEADHSQADGCSAWSSGPSPNSPASTSCSTTPAS